MILLFLPLMALAEENIDLNPIRKLNEDLPTMEYIDSQSEVVQRRSESRFVPPDRAIPLKEILQSGTATGTIGEGKVLYPVKDAVTLVTQKHFYAKYYRLQDEFGYKYLVNEDGSTTHKIKADEIIDIKEETALYVPPLKYTPAPTNIVKREFDKTLSFKPQVGIYTAYVKSTFMEDLYDDSSAGEGYSTQYGISVTTDWDLPINTGLVLHYEKASYRLSDSGSASYSSLSFGPQFVSKDFEFLGGVWRFQTHYRIGPFASIDANSEDSNKNFKFNSSDILFALQHPIKNDWGEFLISPFFQLQWLNIKDQTTPVSIEATNETNKYFGLALSQVFQ